MSTALQLLLITSYALLAKADPQSACDPSGCSANCSPGCAADETCVVGVMTSCGVCPASTCFKTSLIGQSNSTTTSSSPGPMIGGIVGAVVGAGILTAAFFLWRRKRRQRSRTAFDAWQPPIFMHERHPPAPPESTISPQPPVLPFDPDTTFASELSIPPFTPFTPFTSSSSEMKPDEVTQHHSPNAAPPSISGTEASNTLTVTDTDNLTPLEPAINPFADTSSQGDDRFSTASSVQMFSAAQATFATQVVRTKPQVLEIQSLRSKNSNRSNRSNNTRQPVTASENPFDDQYNHQNETNSTPPAEDDEITVVWSGGHAEHVDRNDARDTS